MKLGIKKSIVPLLVLLTAVCGCAAENSGKETETETGPKVETVSTDTFSMDYLRFGHGDKTLVILPGLSVQSVMGSADAVAEAYQMFTDEYTVYLFDRRKELPASYSVRDMAKDTAAAIKALGLENVCLFGTSQGGMISLEIAAAYPELVQKLILGSSAAEVNDETYRLFEKWIALAEEGKAEDLYLAFGEAVYPQNVYEQAHDLLVSAAKTVTEEDLSRFIILASSLKGLRIDPAGITCPVLVLGSDDDNVLGGDSSVQLADLLKKYTECELYMYKGYGHAAYDTAPDYKDRILQFLKS